jgi:hypothetical protein
MIMSKRKEGFDSGIAVYDEYSTNPFGYNTVGEKKYNPFSSLQDVTAKNYANAETDAAINAASQALGEAVRTSEIVPDPKSNTFEGVKSRTPAWGVAPINQVATEAKKCEALNSRDNCSALDDSKYSNCGICIKDRSTSFKAENDKYKHGGLLLLSEDKVAAEQDHGNSAGPVEYVPTAGNCPPNYFFANSASCKRAADRLDCLEAGQNGGFNKGKTSEGKDVIDTKCAAAPYAGADVFIYDPKNRSFDINLRVLAPTGTGITQVYIVDKNSGNQLGYGSSSTPGVDFVVTAKGVNEAQTVDVTIIQEAPFRGAGKAEVFQYIVDPNSQAAPGYNQTQSTATDVCSRIGARIATDAELSQAWSDGSQACSCGYTSGSCGYPSQATKSGCGTNGVNGCGTDPNGWNGGRGHSWCYGVKPPVTTDQQWFTNVLPWFTAYTDSSPDQSTKQNVWSKHGATYQAPATRAVILQWENTTNARRMAQPFETSITAINGQGPNTISSDGLKTFKILRHFGTFNTSSIISSPKPVPGTPIITSQFWMWGNFTSAQSVKFTAQIPGTFLPPAYDEDNVVVPRGQLITKQTTNELLQVSPCMKEGQAAGKYSMACLTNLFVGAGGDISRGKLATLGLVNPYDGSKGNGLSDLNRLGDMDAISTYLDNMYNIASTGVDVTGEPVGGDDPKAHALAVNTAAQLMFGFDVTTPCETVSQDKQGNIIIIPKTGQLDAACLQWLWQNTGSDKERPNTDPARTISPHQGGILNTYTTIKDRFSGLLNGEGTQRARDKSPFQTCQTSGTLAPMNAANIALANSKGSILNIQNWYDSIFQLANYGGSTSDPAVMKQHKNAVAACYGVLKSSDKPPPACTVSPLPTSYTPIQNTILGQALMTTNYSITFNITPSALFWAWTNIVRFQQAPGGKGDCCGFGLRTPAIWFFPGSTALHVRVGDETDGNWGINTDPIPMGQVSNFSLVCAGSSVAVTVNNKTYTAVQPKRRFTGQTTVYGSDPYYPAAAAKVTDFSFSSSTSAIPSSYTPVQNSIIGQTLMTSNYSLSFTVTPSALVGQWANIIRFQQAPGGFGDCCGFGQRSPAIWFFPGSLALHVRIGDQTDGNWGINTDPIPMGQASTVSLVCAGRSVSLTVNGRVYSETQPTQRYAGQMTVYGSDPWYPAASAKVSNLVFTTS